MLKIFLGGGRSPNWGLDPKNFASYIFLCDEGINWAFDEAILMMLTTRSFSWVLANQFIGNMRGCGSLQCQNLKIWENDVLNGAVSLTKSETIFSTGKPSKVNLNIFDWVPVEQKTNNVTIFVALQKEGKLVDEELILPFFSAFMMILRHRERKLISEQI